MLRFLIMLAVITFHEPLYAQFEEIKQLDSVFRVNHVKSRTVTFGSKKHKNKQVEVYDLEGHLIKIDFFYSSDSVLASCVFEYDSAGNKIKSVWSDEPRKVRHYRFFEYNSNNKLSKEGRIDADGKKTYHKIYSYDSLSPEKVISEMLDTVWKFKATTILEKSGIPARSYGYSSGPDRTVNFDYTHENSYDDYGRLISSIRYETDLFSKAMNEYTVNYKATYKYKKTGLLEKLVIIHIINGFKSETSHVFTYEYY